MTLPESLHPAETQRPTVLSIDDDAEISRIIQMRLEPYGVDVLRAFHGMHGFWLAMTETPDVIITDVRMPQGDGSYIVECLRRNTETRNIPIIVLTGQSDLELKTEMHQLGVQGFFTKPVAWESLLDALQPFVELGRSSEANLGAACLSS